MTRFGHSVLLHVAFSKLGLRSPARCSTRRNRSRGFPSAGPKTVLQPEQSPGYRLHPSYSGGARPFPPSQWVDGAPRGLVGRRRRNPTNGRPTRTFGPRCARVRRGGAPYQAKGSGATFQRTRPVRLFSGQQLWNGAIVAMRRPEDGSCPQSARSSLGAKPSLSCN